MRCPPISSSSSACLGSAVAPALLNSARAPPLPNSACAPPLPSARDARSHALAIRTSSSRGTGPSRFLAGSRTALVCRAARGAPVFRGVRRGADPPALPPLPPSPPLAEMLAAVGSTCVAADASACKMCAIRVLETPPGEPQPPPAAAPPGEPRPALAAALTGRHPPEVASIAAAVGGEDGFGGAESGRICGEDGCDECSCASGGAASASRSSSSRHRRAVSLRTIRSCLCRRRVCWWWRSATSA